MIASSTSLPHSLRASTPFLHRMLLCAPRSFPRFTPHLAVSVRNLDPNNKQVPSSSPSSIPSQLSSRTISIIRNRFLQVFATIAASRIRNDAQDHQAFELPSQALETPNETQAYEITAVSADELDPSVQWEQRKKDIEAENARPVLTSPGFSFSAAGFLLPYHLGVVQCLIDRGCITENTPLSGSSAGALACAIFACGLSMHDALLATKELANDCRVNGTAFRLGAALRVVLEKFVPDDAHIKCNGRIRVAITQLFRSPRGLLVDYFSSKADLINALLTSCFIPGYFAPRPITLYKNRLCMDGGITLFMPPTSANITVRICAFPASQLGLKGIGISPDCNSTPDRASTRQLLSWALEPPADEILEDLFGLGYQDALVWVTQYKVLENDAEFPCLSYD